MKNISARSFLCQRMNVAVADSSLFNSSQFLAAFGYLFQMSHLLMVEFSLHNRSISKSLVLETKQAIEQ